MRRRLSLRARLVLAVVALAGVGLAFADVATYTSLRSFMLHRVDMSLDAGLRRSRRTSPHGGAGGPGGEGPASDAGRRLVRGADARRGGVLAQEVPRARARPRRPDVPATIKLPAAASGPDHERSTYFTVPAESGHGRYRVRASVERSGSNHVLLVGASLAAVDARCTACS